MPDTDFTPALEEFYARRAGPGGPFKHGDVVKLKSSAVKMTVEQVFAGGVICVWFDRDKLCRERFSTHTLELAS